MSDVIETVIKNSEDRSDSEDAAREARIAFESIASTAIGLYAAGRLTTQGAQASVALIKRRVEDFIVAVRDEAREMEERGDAD